MSSVTPQLRDAASCLPPLATAALGISGLGLVFPADPATSSGYLRCPLRDDGTLVSGLRRHRATHKAVHGDVIGALGTNLFLPVFAVLAVAAWLTWFLPTIDRRAGSRAVPQGRCGWRWVLHCCCSPCCATCLRAAPRSAP